MRSFIAHCCLSGISTWTIADYLADTLPVRAMKKSPLLHISECSPACKALSFALGQANSSSRPVIVAVDLNREDNREVASILHIAKEKALPLVIADFSTDTRSVDSFKESEEKNCHDWHSNPDVLKHWNYRSPLLIGIEKSKCEQLVDNSDLSELSPPPPPKAKYPRPNVGDLALALRNEYFKGVAIMAGALHPDDVDPALWLADTLNVPVIANALSGIREETGNNLVHDEKAVLQTFFPGIVIRIGDIPLSPAWTMLEQHHETKVFSISRHHDTGLERASSMIESPLEAVLKALGDLSSIGDVLSLMPVSRKREAFKEELLMRYPESAQSLLHSISQFAGLSGYCYLSGELLISSWNDYAQTNIPVDRVSGNNAPVHVASEISRFLGESATLEEAWFISEGIEISEEIIQLLKKQHACKKIIITRVFFSHQPLENMFNEDRDVRHMNIRNSFDLDLLDEIGVDGIYLVDVYPDNNQTHSFSQQFA